MSTHGSESWRIIASALLLLACGSGLTSAVAPALGFSWHSPTQTYQGYLSTAYYGVYKVVRVTPACRANFPPCLDSDAVVFYLVLDNGFLIRLMFTCRLNYCAQPNDVPLPAGAHIYVNGTLLEPSQWQPALSEPHLYFIGDLYVLQYHTA